MANKIHLSERLFQKKVDLFTRARSLPADSDCLALQELSQSACMA